MTDKFAVLNAAAGIEPSDDAVTAIAKAIIFSNAMGWDLDIMYETAAKAGITKEALDLRIASLREGSSRVN